MHSVDEVLRIIEKTVPAAGAEERVAVGNAYGRVLGAEGVKMDGDSPPFDRSVLDGYAVRSVDAVAGAVLRIVGRQDAGEGVFAGTVGQGECLGINTGGVFPKGADAVLMVEHSEQAGDGVRVTKAVGPGYGVQRRGADARAGAEVLKAATILRRK